MDQILYIDEVINSLKEAGYIVPRPMGLFDPQYWNKSSFDIVARKDVLLMIKIVTNIDVISNELVEDLKLISFFFNGIPLLIGKETRKEPLRDDVVYERRGIPAMNLTTFKKIINNNEIYVISRKGGFYSKVDNEKIRRVRLEQGFSLQDVAVQLGVSRKAVYLFERENQIKAENVEQLERIFKQKFKLPINIFSWEIEKEFNPSVKETDFQAEIKEILADLNFTIDWVKKAPFDAITSNPDEKQLKAEESCLITSLSFSHRMQLYNRLELIREISKVAHKLAMFIIEDGKLPTVDNVLIIQKTILEKMKDIHDLYKLLKKVKRNFISP